MGFLLDFGTVPTMEFCFVFHFISNNIVICHYPISDFSTHKKKPKKPPNKSTLVSTSPCLPSKIDNLSFIKKKVKHLS